MRSSYRIFSAFGIPVELHITFVLFLLFLLFAGGIPSLLFFILLFVIVLAHELCHSIVAMGFGIKVPRITLTPIGGVASVELPENPVQELAVSIAGPMFNLILAGASFIMLVSFGMNLTGYNNVVDVFLSQSGSITLSTILNLMVYINLLLGVFNALPAFPMDGGRILRSILAFWVDYITATKVALNVGKIFFLFLFLAGLLTGNLWWMVIGFVAPWMGGSELRFVMIRKIFRGVTLGDIAARNVKMVNEHVRVMDFLSLIAVRGERFYFVVDVSGNIRGLVDLNALQSKKINAGDEIAKYASKGLVAASSKMGIDQALGGILAEDVVLVVDDGRLVGYVTKELVEDSIGYYSVVEKSRV